MAPNLRWFHRLTAAIRSRRLQSDLDDELLFHLEARTRDNIAGGMAPDDAALAARRLFGNRTLMTERMRDADVNRWLDALLRDLRYALRLLWRAPGFAAVVVVSMMLGIGANTAVFSLLDAAFLRQLPVRNPGELVLLQGRVKGPDGAQTGIDWHRDLENFQAHAGQHVELFTTSRLSAITTFDDRAERISVGMVSGNYYGVLGVEPSLGRLLDAADDNAHEPQRVAVLDYGFWRRRFGGDPSIAGRPIVLNGISFTIVGVGPRGFTGTEIAPPPSLTIPVGTEPVFNDGESYRTIGGRLRPGVTREQAASVLTSLYQASRQHRDDVIVAMDNSRGEYGDRDRFAQPLYVLMGAVTLVLLIASANVASLLLARGAARRREISIRLALGAARGRIAAQVLTESVLIAVLGGALGVALAYYGASALVATLSAGSTALPLDVRPDARVLMFTTCVAVLTGIVFGLFPAYQACRTELNPTLKEAAGIVGRRPRLLARRALVTAQVALSLVLLSGAILFARSLANLRTFDTGYDRRGVLLASFEPDRRYTKDQHHELQARLLERIRNIPGVQAAGLASTTVLRKGEYSNGLQMDVDTPPCLASMTIASPGYLETMGMRLVAGRFFTADDNRAGAPHTVIVNQAIVSRCFGTTNPIGQRVKGGFGVNAEIVGVVSDAKYRDLRESTVSMYYIPPRSVHPYGLDLHVRTAGNPRAVAEPIRRALHELDPHVPLTRVRTLEEQSDASVVPDRLLATVSALFGAAALALAGIGLYGVVAFMVARRTNEIGLRMALGARRLDIVRLVLSESTFLLAIGGVLGAMGGYAGLRLVRGILFGVSPSEGWSLAAAALVLAAVGVFASLVPARRAARIDPMTALRHD